MEVTHCDADSITAAVLDSLEKSEVPTDIIGYASDTTNVMFGQHHSVVTCLEKIPHLFVMRCICHSAQVVEPHKILKPAQTRWLSLQM